VRRALVLVILLVVLVVGAAGVARSSVFGLHTLVVTGPGGPFVTEQSLGVTRNTSLLLVSDRDLATRAVAADPWAASAQVRAVLPHELEIQLTGRTAVALVRDGAIVWSVDATGMVLPATAKERLSLPYLSGVPSPTASLVADTAPALLAAAGVAAALPASVRGQVSEVHALSGGQAFELILMDGRPVELGAPTALAAKLRLLPLLLARYPWPEYAGTGFDLRNPRRPSLYSVGR